MAKAIPTVPLFPLDFLTNKAQWEKTLCACLIPARAKLSQQILFSNVPIQRVERRRKSSIQWCTSWSIINIFLILAIFGVTDDQEIVPAENLP